MESAAQALGGDSEPTIEVEAVSKWFGTTVALDEVTLSVEAGRVLALFGPNGAGKTKGTQTADRREYPVLRLSIPIPRYWAAGKPS